MIDSAAALAAPAPQGDAPASGTDGSPEEFAAALTAAEAETGPNDDAPEVTGDEAVDTSSPDEGAEDDPTLPDAVDGAPPGAAVLEALLAAAGSAPATADTDDGATGDGITGDGTTGDGSTGDTPVDALDGVEVVSTEAPGEAVDPALPEPAPEADLPTSSADVATDDVTGPDGPLPAGPRPGTGTQTPTTPMTPASADGPQPERISAPAPATTTAESAPAARPEPSPALQIATALRDVRKLTDGTHRLSLQLRPAELGTVQLEIALRGGRLHVHAVADTESAARALQSSLPDLRNELRSAGVEAGSLEVRDHATGGNAQDRSHPDARPAPTRPNTVGAAAVSDAAAGPARPSTSTLVDVRL